MACPDCGREVSARAPHCPHCGCPVAEVTAAARCPDCGRDVQPDMASCPTCGAPLQDETDAARPATLGTTDPRPALRWFARMTDYLLAAFAAGLVVGLAAPDLLEGNDYLFSVAVVAAFVPVEAVLLARFGTTPGKWLLALTVVDAGGRRLLFDASLRRAVLVVWRGLGALLPIVPLFTMAHQARRLTKTGRTSWDRELDAEVIAAPIGPGRVLLLLVVWGIFALLVGVQAEAL